MSSKRYHQIVNAAYKNGDLNAMRDAFNDFQDTHCLNPKRQLIFDSHTGESRFIDVSCGHCYHCMQSKINEWTTRMYAHVEDFKHVYFVTLTYRSITNPNLPINKLFLNKLVQAVWNKDAFNKTHHMSYNPCLLVKKHYQDFLKRLRKNTGIPDLTYVLSGEYGSEFGRPHFHAILFTNQSITSQDIARAWSFSIFRKNDGTFAYYKNQKDGVRYNMPIGHFDFHDLVSNGTFNTKCKIKVDSTYMNAANCFAYVCKYVVKRDDANLNRVRLAYRNLFKKYTLPNTIGKTKYQVLFYDRSLHFTPEQILQLNQLKLNVYEKNLYQPAESVYQHGLCRSRQVKNHFYFFREVLLPEFYSDFCDSFKPFCEFSRGTPIGSIYARRHIQEFTQGVFNKPLLQDKGYIVPKYFRTKAQEQIYGLRKTRKTLKSASLNLGNLSDLYRRFSESLQTGLPLREHFDDNGDYQRVNAMLQTPSRYFTEKSTGERIVFYNNYAQFYKYERKGKHFKFTRAVSLKEWIIDSIARLEAEFNSYANRRRISQENMRLSEAANLMLLDYGDDFETLRDRYIKRVEAIKRQKQLEYKQQHLSVE